MFTRNSSLLCFVLMCSCVSRAVDINSPLLKLIVNSYIESLLDSTLTGKNIEFHLNQLGNHIANHPALEEDRLFVGDAPPKYHPHSMSEADENNIHKRQDKISPPSTSTNTLFPHRQSDRGSIDKFNSRQEPPSSKLPSEEICTTDRQWEQINETSDLNDNQVKVIQKDGMNQFIFTYRCANSKVACTGVQPYFHSECTERFGWVYLYHQNGNHTPKWGYVAAPHHCACKIQPTVTPTTER